MVRPFGLTKRRQRGQAPFLTCELSQLGPDTAAGAVFIESSTQRPYARSAFCLLPSAFCLLTLPDQLQIQDRFENRPEDVATAIRITTVL